MQIKDMFAKDINRPINGVVKVQQTDEQCIRQELEEYVITHELRRHFGRLLENYSEALDVPTDKVGVWISGFFGSGKSHFLKMLSYLLSNRVVCGKHAIDYFEDKFEDPLMAANARRCASVPCEAILFNIDSVDAPGDDKTAVLRAFTRVFYDHLGYYGADMSLVRLEQAIDKKGKREEFRAAYERLTGGSWLQERADYDFNQDDVIEALAQAGVMSREAATRWFDGSQNVEPSVDMLVDDIGAYVARRAEESGGNFRLLFMVDEMGQFIAGDVSRMLKLQSFVEEVGARCQGRVWVMVTGQEAIDEITNVAGNDFSKIQGRFNTRLSLSSSSVDEVIKRRVLAKNADATADLAQAYARHAVELKNLFAFTDSRGDLRGFAGEDDFVASFPFADYQFKLMPNVLKQLRLHGSSGKHLSGGERSMLSGFQEAAQAVQTGDEGTLVPLWRFYDTLSSFLEGYIRSVVERCARAAEERAGLQPQDVRVLKLLFLVRYVDDLKATLGNVTIMMAEHVDEDVLALKKQVKASLDRLVEQNYVARSGEVYTFLTSEEQDIAREISEIRPELSAITREIGETIFDDVLGEARDVRVDGVDYPVDAFVDEQAYGNSRGGVTLRVVTSASDLAQAGEQALLMKSSAPEAVVALAAGEGDYYACARHMLQIKAYVASKQSVMAQLPEKTRSIIRERNDEKNALDKELRRMLEAALAKARVFVAGREVTEGRSDNARRRVDYALVQLVGAVYSQRGAVQLHVENDVGLREILLGRANALGEDPNAQAVELVASKLKTAQMSHGTLTMKDLQDCYRRAPFGWSEYDVAAVVARLVADGRAQVEVSGVPRRADDPDMPGYLHTRTQVARTQVSLREKVSAPVMGAVAAFVREALQDAPRQVGVTAESEDALADGVRAWLAETEGQLEDMRGRYARGTYPGKDVVEAAGGLVRKLKACEADPARLITCVHENLDELEDAVDDLADVRSFFEQQVDVYDEARRLSERMAGEDSYLADAPEATAALATIREILGLARPYGRIRELSGLMARVRDAHASLVQGKRAAVLDELKQAEAQVAAYAERKGAPVSADGRDARWLPLRNQANAARTCMELDALTVRLASERDAAFAAVDAACAPQPRRAPSVVAAHAPAAPAPAPARRVSRSAACPSELLSTPAEVDAYAQRLAQTLKAELAKAQASGEGGIRLG